MFNLNSSLNSGWDTNFARKFLQISKDQLEKINKIPGWSKTEISEKTITENDKNLENVEKQLIQQASSSTGNNLISNTGIFAKADNLKNQNDNSCLQSKANPFAPLNEKELFLKNVSLSLSPFAPLNEKELFLKNVSLSPLRKKHTSVCSLQRSSSLPNLYEKLLSYEVLSHNKSEEIDRKRGNSIGKDISSLKLAPLLKRKKLNQTYSFPVVSDDDVNHDKLSKIRHKSCPLENPNQLSKQKSVKTLDDSILNSQYLKDTVTSVINSDSVPFFSNGTVQTALKREMSLFEKKLLLLEKRLSPSKEMSPLPLNSRIINLGNLTEKNQKSFPSPTPAASSDSVQNLPDEIENSSATKDHKSIEPQVNIQSLNEKNDALKNTFESPKNRIDDASKTAACNFDSFLSPPLPCGQPLPTEVPSLSQPIPSQKPAELSTPCKSLNASPPVPSGQPLATEVQSLSAKLNIPNTQNLEVSGKVMAPEKPGCTFSVFSANSNEKVSHLASGEEMGTKRKRRNRSEKSSKKSDVKKLKRTNIQFSSAQIRSMIEIMKIFHAEI